MRIKFFIAVLIQLLILLSIVAYKQYIISTGEKVHIVTHLFDPRDMLKGEYVRLTYDMSTLNTAKFGVKDEFKDRETIYVTLGKNSDGTYSPLTFGKNKPNGGTFIKGKVKTAYKNHTGTVTIKEDSGQTREFSYYWQSNENIGTRHVFCVNKEGNMLFHWPERDDKNRICQGDMSRVYGTVERVIKHEDTQINAEFGIESFYVEEGKGRAIESEMTRSAVVAVVYVSKDGKAVLSNLIVNGRELR